MLTYTPGGYMIAARIYTPGGYILTSRKDTLGGYIKPKNTNKKRKGEFAYGDEEMPALQ